MSARSPKRPLVVDSVFHPTGDQVLLVPESAIVWLVVNVIELIRLGKTIR